MMSQRLGEERRCCQSGRRTEALQQLLLTAQRRAPPTIPGTELQGFSQGETQRRGNGSRCRAWWACRWCVQWGLCSCCFAAAGAREIRPPANDDCEYTVHGYLAYEKTPTPLGPPWVPRHRATVGS